MSEPVFVYEIYIHASIERVWRALTESEFTAQYFYATYVESDWQPGSPVVFRRADGEIAVSGEVIQCEAPHHLEISWRVHYDPAKYAEGASRVRFELQTHQQQTLLRVTHDGFAGDSTVYPSICEGWPWILSGLKTLLETPQRQAEGF